MLEHPKLKKPQATLARLEAEFREAQAQVQEARRAAAAAPEEDKEACVQARVENKPAPKLKAIAAERAKDEAERDWHNAREAEERGKTALAEALVGVRDEILARERKELAAWGGRWQAALDALVALEREGRGIEARIVEAKGGKPAAYRFVPQAPISGDGSWPTVEGTIDALRKRGLPPESQRSDGPGFIGKKLRFADGTQLAAVTGGEAA
jgi:hypothetical protein